MLMNKEMGPKHTHTHTRWVARRVSSVTGVGWDLPGQKDNLALLLFLARLLAIRQPIVWPILLLSSLLLLTEGRNFQHIGAIFFYKVAFFMMVATCGGCSTIPSPFCCWRRLAFIKYLLLPPQWQLGVFPASSLGWSCPRVGFSTCLIRQLKFV